MVTYEQPRPRRGVLSILAKTLFALVALAVMVAAAGVAGTWLYGEDTVAQIQPREKAVKETVKQLAIPLPGKPAIALVVGYDKRFQGSGAGQPSRSDTLMMIRMDPQNKDMTILSFPRDLQVPLYCPGHTYAPDRINAAWSYGGPRCTVATVEALTGVRPNYLVTVNFKGFVDVVNRLNGIWVDVDRRYYHVNDGTIAGDYASINIQPGYQKLYGHDALSFVRYRHTDSDLVRNARQQQFMRAVKDRISSDFSASTIPRVVGALRRNIEVAAGGHPISLTTLLGWAMTLYGMPSGNVIRVTIPNITGAGVPGDPLVAPQSSVDDAVQQFLNPDVQAPQQAAAVALGQKLKLKHGLPPGQVTVVALNGNAVQGSAANASAQLKSRGYRTLLPPNGLEANAPTYTYFRTQVMYNPGYARSKAAAKQVADLFGSADVQPLPSDQSAASRQIRHLSHGAMLVTIIGKTFKGNLAPAPKNTTPKRTAPLVTKDPAMAFSLLQSIRRKVPFQLENPSMIERSSHLDTEDPMRLYTISGNNKAVRLTFTNGYQYWGIEETDWTGAPIFGGNNETRRIKHRTYQLYFSGSHLHMVVLRKGNQTYWVVNTLNDDLSNDTMLAIAQGLQPMKRG
jgi:LCP family protein required for cell wall assembly